MALVIDANMKLFAEKMHISSSRMINDYGLSTVDEIIEAETERGNSHALSYAKEYYHSPEKLIKLFKLYDIENKFVILKHMDYSTRLRVLPMLEQEDLVMGLYFFTQDKLLEMLMNVDIEELVNVVKEAFSIEQIVLMYTEEDLMYFFGNMDLDRNLVMEEVKSLPPEIMQKFVESVTGTTYDAQNQTNLLTSMANLPDDKFHKFMASIDPNVQRQLTFQIFKKDTKNMTLFNNMTYINMLNKLMKPDMVKPMIMLNKETLMLMIAKLPDDLMSIVAAQVDTKELAKFLQKKNHIKFVENALMI